MAEAGMVAEVASTQHLRKKKDEEESTKAA